MKIHVNSTGISGGVDSGGEAAGRGCGTIFFGLFLVLGLMFVVLIVGEAVKQTVPWFWPETG